MTTSLTVNVNTMRAEGTESEIKISPDSETWSFVSGRHPRRVPLFIPEDQAYYWSYEWQESIRESHAELEAGNYVDFDDPNDPDAVVRWFNSNH